MKMENIKQLAQYIKDSKKITVLTGAGISTASGIPDFKTTTENWEYELSRERIMSVSYFNKHPKLFWPIYKDVFKTKVFEELEPNEGHYFLAELEQMGKDVTIITQNVDGLHIKAGSSKVYEVHGSLQKSTCPKCGEVYDLQYIRDHDVPRCNRKKAMGTCNFILNPGVVLFEAGINYYKESFQAVMHSDLFLTIGTSLEVGPINQLAIAAKHDPYKDSDKFKSAIINGTITPLDYCFDTVIHAGINRTFEEVKKLL